MKDSGPNIFCFIILHVATDKLLKPFENANKKTLFDWLLVCVCGDPEIQTGNKMALSRRKVALMY